MAVIAGKDEYSAKAAGPIRSVNRLMSQAPGGTGHWLAALDFYVSITQEIAIIGPREGEGTQALLEEVFSRYLPNKVLVGASGGEGDDPVAALGLPLLEDRGMEDGKPTAYVCQNYACQLPVTDPEALAGQLTGG